MTCVLCGERDQDPDIGQADPLCAARLRGRLRQLPELVDELTNPEPVVDDRAGTRAVLLIEDDVRKIVREPGHPADPIASALPSGPLNAPRSGPRVSGSTEPPVPIRVDPTDLLAPARVPSLTTAGRKWWKDQTGQMSVATVLDGWVRDWAESRGENLPQSPTVAVLAGWLVARLDWALRHHPAVDEFAGEVDDAYWALMRAAGLTTPRPEALAAPCRSCEVLGLYRDPDTGRIPCAACTAILTEEEYAEHCRDLAGAHRALAENDTEDEEAA